MNEMPAVDIWRGGKDGRLACHSQQGCQEHCPMGVSPAAAIAGMNRAAAVAAWQGKR